MIRFLMWPGFGQSLKYVHMWSALVQSHQGIDSELRGRCLAYRAQDRLDVEAAALHPYLALKRGRIGKDAL